MTTEEIISYWKQGYTVEQIVQKSELAKRYKDNEKIIYWIRYKVERAIYKYEVG